MPSARRALLRVDAFRLALYAGLVVSALHVLDVLFAQQGSQLPVISRIEHAAQDYVLTTLRGPRAPSGRVVVVAVDERSVEAEGMWPWSRATMARLVDALAEGGVAAVGFDVVWSDQDQQGRRLAEVAGLVKAARAEASDPAQARRLDQAWAAAGGVASDCLPSKGVADRAAYDAALVARLAGAGVDLVCLAGYMRLVTPTFLRAFGPSATSRGCPRVVNVHPALLPAFPGLHAQAQALAAGVKLAGCTVHFVDEGTDTGPVIAQAAVPVLDGDDEASLAARILVEEHRLYPQAVGWFAAGRLSLAGRRVLVDGAAAQGALRSPALDQA